MCRDANFKSIYESEIELTVKDGVVTSLVESKNDRSLCK